MKPKSEIRAEMRALRRTVTSEARAAASEAVCGKLVARCAGRSTVAVYLASPQEIDLAPFIRKALETGVRLVAPRWNGASYELATLKGLSAADLRTGPMGILEPAGAELVLPRDVGVWIVPGLAFTRDGRRLGYGGGWYDRLLADAAADAPRFGVAYGFQIVADLPSEPHDVPLSFVVDDSAE